MSNDRAVLLHQFMAARRAMPYAWGTNDCAIFAADAVLAITGEDPLGELRGAWTDEATAASVLQAQGGLIAAMDARFPRRDPAFAKRGDLVLVKDGNGQPSLAVVTGKDAFAPGVSGLVPYPAAKARLAWEA